MADKDEKDLYIEHYGTPRHSGRYPWGSGKKYQRSRNFMSQYEDLRKQGLSKSKIAERLGLKNTSELNARRAMALEEKSLADQAFAQKLYDKGMSKTAIAARIGVTEGTVRNLLKSAVNKNAKEKSIMNVARSLGDQIRDKTYLDVGASTNLYLGITEQKLKDALVVLQDQGYKMIYPRIQQAGTQFRTTTKVMIPPGVTTQEAYDQIRKDATSIRSLNEIHFNENGHGTVDVIHDPVSIDKNRITIRYGDEGGKAKDGVIELRPGVKDLDLGDSHYAQVRIVTNDGKSYLKGMAMYNYNMPEGTDIIFNTNKASGTPFEKVLKGSNMSDPHNPFGAAVDRQNDWYDEKGEKHLGALNIIREEGKWDTWSSNLASQFLSKQPLSLAKRQLTIAAEQREAEYEKIDALTNPTLKKQLLNDFADECDSAAVSLKGASMPRQSTKVLLPIPSLSDKECYAPTYDNGEEVILIRYPHGGRFEIPRLTVNNNNREANKVITKEAHDAIGINPNVAEQLSGADFDGDTAVVIPTKGQNIKTESVIKDLQEFDPKERYARPEGTNPPWKKGSRAERRQMGQISNLITDMTLQDAPIEKIVRAVKHSMTIIDAGKHNLDYKASYEENGIAALKAEYQHKDSGRHGGASTLISKAKGQHNVTLRDYMRPEVDETGKKTYAPAKDSERFYIQRQAFMKKDAAEKFDKIKKKIQTAKTEEEKNKLYEEMNAIPGVKENREAHRLLEEKFKEIREAPTDKEKNRLRSELMTIRGVAERTTTSTNMAETDDAFTLSSGLPMETVYAEYANRMKALGRKARLEAKKTGDLAYDPVAAKTYAKEVASLKEQLERHDKNRPLERAAQRIVASKMQLIEQENPDMEDDERKKRKNQLLREAREATGAKSYQVKISDKEWDAIQSGALRKTFIERLFTAADNEEIIKRALPRDDHKLSATMIARAKRMLSGDYSLAEVSEALGVSVKTLQENVGKYVKKGD